MIDSIKYTKWLDDDPRARKEMEATLEVINQYRNNRVEIRKLY